ncbi:sodium/proton antiporter, NhaA family [Azotobacter beijerinckii]|uniref:Na(+)/H(+) antiporter NhaA n=1 Tax=Azotobacter beijerinckii TaxID=170623 RepID=A0A1H6QKM0_9GAMM|nr:Na+/H+ antiporter NhaA [Azotobacter beijerinckii]SEI39542.1 sodium/proton antiporter, NhaA family [Azotobacter beijerinckii]
MHDDQQGNADSARLPEESVHWLSKPLARFLRIEAVAAAVLLFFTVAAVGLANSPWAEAFLGAWETPIGLQVGSLDFVRSIRDWIGDGLMTLFFFLVAVELKRELVLGELRHPRMAALSVSAALGGMGVPAALYLLLQSGRPGEAGWGAVMATDTAFVIGCLALLKSRIPQSLRVFMLSLAIVDDIGAILVVAIGYGGHQLSWSALAVAAVGLAVVRLMALVGIRSMSLYVLAGAFIWFAVDRSGIHATITGVLLGLMTPTGRWVSDERLYRILDRVVAHPAGNEGSGATRDRQSLRLAETAARETLAPAERIQIALHPWVAYLVMPLFAFANAGVPLSLGDLGDAVTVAVFVGFALGKPAGILAFTWLALRLGAIKPAELEWKLLAGGSILAGIGFTMALFISNLAFGRSLLNQAKLGIFLASLFSAAVGLALLFWVTRQGKRVP